MAGTSATTTVALLFVATVLVTVMASRTDRYSNNGLYGYLNREPSSYRRFSNDFYNSLRLYKDRRVKRFPVGLYYSLMGEDLTNPHKRTELSGDQITTMSMFINLDELFGEATSVKIDNR
ncbi:hypothetical protein V3C99_012938 [Haemonchus contortus]